MHYGIYFYLHKLKIIDNKLLLQLYFYKTRFYRKFRYFSKNLAKEISPEKYSRNMNPYRNNVLIKNKKILYIFNSALFLVINKNFSKIRKTILSNYLLNKLMFQYYPIFKTHF